VTPPGKCPDCVLPTITPAQERLFSQAASDSDEWVAVGQLTRRRVEWCNGGVDPQAPRACVKIRWWTRSHQEPWALGVMVGEPVTDRECGTGTEPARGALAASAGGGVVNVVVVTSCEATKGPALGLGSGGSSFQLEPLESEGYPTQQADPCINQTCTTRKE
jgi:hypothetical protein